MNEPANWHLALLGRVVLDRDFQALYRAGITLDILTDPEAQRIYLALQDHVARHGELPTPRFLVGVFPSLRPYLSKRGDPISALAERVRSIYLYDALQEGLEEVVHQMEDDPGAAVTLLSQLGQRLSAATAARGDYFVGSNVRDIYEEYRQARKGTSLYIPFPWPSLQKASGGIQPESFLLYYGRPKAGKTWTLIAHADEAELHRKEIVLLCTHEMSVKSLGVRIAARRARIDTDRFRRGRLGRAELERFRNALLDIRKTNRFVIVPLGAEQEEAPLAEVLDQKIPVYRPCLILIDSLYLYRARGARRREPFSNFEALTKEMRQLARRHRVPIIATSAANRAGQDKGRATLRNDGGDISFSDAGVRDTDMFIRIELNKSLRVLGLNPQARDYPTHPFVINYHPAHDFEETNRCTVEEAFGAKSAGARRQVSQRKLVQALASSL